MSEINFTVSTNTEAVKDLVDTWLYKNFSSGDIAREIADEIDVQQVADYVAQDVDWDDVSETIYDNFRDNHIEDVADYLKEDVATFIIDADGFYEMIETPIADAVGRYYSEGVLNEKLEQLNKRIVDLENKIADMSKKKFWKKMMKGK